MTLQKKKQSKHIDWGSEEDLGSIFKMTDWVFILWIYIEAKLGPISEPGNICVSLELLPLRKSVFVQAKKNWKL